MAARMDGYRYWVERHKLLVELADKKAELAERDEAEANLRAVELERDFRGRLDALYGQARDEFEGRRTN